MEKREGVKEERPQVLIPWNHVLSRDSPRKEMSLVSLARQGRWYLGACRPRGVITGESRPDDYLHHLYGWWGHGVSNPGSMGFCISSTHIVLMVIQRTVQVRDVKTELLRNEATHKRHTVWGQRRGRGWMLVALLPVVLSLASASSLLLSPRPPLPHTHYLLLFSLQWLGREWGAWLGQNLLGVNSCIFSGGVLCWSNPHIHT